MLIDFYRRHLDKILQRRGAFTDPDWVPGELATQTLETMRVLVMLVETLY